MHNSRYKVVIHGTRVNLYQELRELFNFKDLLLGLTSREIKSRYKQSVLGLLWAIIPPFFTMILLTIVFSVFIKIDTKNVPYPVFSYAALVPWLFFTRSIEHGTKSIVSVAGIVTKVYFPREIIPLSVIIANFIDYLISLIILFALMLYFHIPFTSYILWFIPVLGLQILLTASITLFTSALNVVLRDIGFVMPLIFQLWFYASPIIYPLEQVPAEWMTLYMLNPMAVIIHAYRQIFIYQQTPPLDYLLIAAGAFSVMFILTYLFFKKAERYFADLI